MSPGLRRYIAIRILLTIPMILILVSVVFIVLRVLPGDPALAIMREGASEEQLEAFRETLGINKPLLEQYVEFVGDLIRFDFGESMFNRRLVVDEIKTYLPATIELALASMVVIAGVGIISGSYAAHHRKSKSDYSIRILSIVLYSMPIFWLGIILQMVF